MITASTTFSQIRAQLQAIRDHLPEGKDDLRGRAVGIHAKSRWTGESHPEADGEVYLVRQCDSPLQMRLALREGAPEGAVRVLITPLGEREIGEEIRIRLVRRRLHPLDRWGIVKNRFGASRVDPRLACHPWIAEFLLEGLPEQGYPPAPGGFLDADTVWPILLKSRLGLSVETPDLQAILKWSADPDAVQRYRESPPDFRQTASDWLVSQAGPTAGVILKCLRENPEGDALAVGLAAGPVFSAEAEGRLEKAAGRLERFLGQSLPAEPVMRRWHVAAAEVVRLQLSDPRSKLERADEILREIEADGFAFVSDTSPLGFDQRLARYGDALRRFAADRKSAALAELEQLRRDVLRHDQAGLESPRLDRLTMSFRLAQWLADLSARPREPAASFAEAADRYLSEGCFVDWARRAIASGDPVAPLSTGFSALSGCATASQEERALQFALLLRDWTATGAEAKGVIPVERFLDEILAPLARQQPLLLVVVDGMSAAVARELLADMSRLQWQALCEKGRSANRPIIATVPSVTEFSRASLLSGKLCQGDSTKEAVAFAAHPALRAAGRASHPPALFHKVDLRGPEDAGLSAEVRQSVADAQQRVVGVVLNAVDDHLLKSDQLELRWTLEQFKILPTLLQEARAAGRVLVLVSDHGHVLDRGTEYRAFEASERWRPAAGDPAPDEVRIEGGRVSAPQRRIIVPASENIRYSKGKRNGYHGGANPQEMVVLFAVLSSGSIPAGWEEAPVETPSWWDEPIAVGQPAEFRERPIGPVAAEIGLPLFDLAKKRTESEPSAPKQADWIKKLLSSSLFGEQKKLARRGAPEDQAVRDFLEVIAARGGKITSTALARSLEMPPFRIPGLVASLQRLLNIEGYGIVSRDLSSDTIELHLELLLQQFELDDDER